MRKQSGNLTALLAMSRRKLEAAPSLVRKSHESLDPHAPTVRICADPWRSVLEVLGTRYPPIFRL